MLKTPKFLKANFIWSLLTHTDQFNNYEKDVNEAKREINKYFPLQYSETENIFVI